MASLVTELWAFKGSSLIGCGPVVLVLQLAVSVVQGCVPCSHIVLAVVWGREALEPHLVQVCHRLPRTYSLELSLKHRMALDPQIARA